MANKKPFFLSGANAKIKLNGKTLAYATDISYRIEVKHASPRVLGRFEVETHQPLSYDVSGSFTIIKYTAGIEDLFGDRAPMHTTGNGNGVGSWGLNPGIQGAIGNALGLPNSNGQFDGRADDAFIPSRMFQSKMFDIEIWQKVPGADNNSFLSVLDGFLNNPLGAAVGGDSVLSKNDQCQVALLQDCRLTMSEFSVSKKTAAKQKFNFVCRYAHEDTFVARKSGVGQELT